MKRITHIITAIAIVIGAFVVPVALPHAAQAQNDPNAQALCLGSGGNWDVDKQICSSSSGRSVPQTLRAITNLLVFIVGAAAVIMIIVGGLRYVTSGGDQAGTKSAKDTILYSVIGVVVAIMAYAIVNFIFDAFNIK